MTKVGLFSYEVLVSFTSKTLGKTFYPGEIIKAPLSLGFLWCQSKIAQPFKKHKTIKP
jgi:hypothetical protein